MQEVKIRYKKGVKESSDGIKEPVWGWMSPEMKCTRRYNEAMCLMMGITGCPAHLIEWISGNVGDTGFINNNVITRNNFIEFHSKHKGKTKKTYGEDIVNKSFKKLCDAGFLISVTKGLYRVDPLLYFIEDDSKRIESIKYTMEFKAQQETKMTMEVKTKK